MFDRLFAICLLVEDFEDSLDFYTSKLGLKINSRDGEFADFVIEGTSLALFGKDAAISMFPKQYMADGGGTVIAFQVENLDQGIDKLNKCGVEIFEGPKETPWGQKVAYFKDPDGNVLEISEK
jgi:catechol 2,3-dioxygenase-like lactoylglutathione lyase family enzyme